MNNPVWRSSLLAYGWPPGKDFITKEPKKTNLRTAKPLKMYTGNIITHLTWHAHGQIIYQEIRKSNTAENLQEIMLK